MLALLSCLKLCRELQECSFPMLSPVLVTEVAFESQLPLLLSVTPHHTPVINPKLDLDATVTLVCLGFTFWGDSVYSIRKSVTAR